VHNAGVVPGLVHRNTLFFFQDRDVRQPAAAEGTSDRNANNAAANDAYVLNQCCGPACLSRDGFRLVKSMPSGAAAVRSRLDVAPAPG
jgi:hypothetical protein